MFSVKIPGSRYLLAMETVRGEWTLKILLDNNTEAEGKISAMNKRAIHSQMEALLKEVKIQVSPVQIDLMHKDLTTQAAHLLQEGGGEGTVDKGNDLTGVNTKIKEILESFSKLEDKIDAMNDRLERLEQMSTS